MPANTLDMTAIPDADSLPQELVHKVLSYCTPSEWFIAALVSPIFQIEAETLLYRDINLPDSDHCKMLCDAVKRRRPRAKNVRSLCLKGGISSSQILSLLLELTALTTLEVHWSLGGHELGSLPILPFKLRKLAVAFHGANLFAQDWAGFVVQQHTTLECLELAFDYDGMLGPLYDLAVAAGTGFLPSLHTVESTPDFLLALIRGGQRPLLRLASHHAGGLFPGHPTRDFAATLCRDVVACTANITALRLGAHDPWDTLVTVTSSAAFPGLQSLELMMETEVRLRKLAENLRRDPARSTREPCLDKLVLRVGICASYSPQWQMNKGLLATMKTCCAALRAYVHQPDATPAPYALVVHYLDLFNGKGFWSCPTRALVE